MDSVSKNILAALCKDKGTVVKTYSSDLVFDGEVREAMYVLLCELIQQHNKTVVFTTFGRAAGAPLLIPRRVPLPPGATLVSHNSEMMVWDTASGGRGSLMMLSSDEPPLRGLQADCVVLHCARQGHGISEYRVPKALVHDGLVPLFSMHEGPQLVLWMPDDMQREIVAAPAPPPAAAEAPLPDEDTSVA